MLYELNIIHILGIIYEVKSLNTSYDIVIMKLYIRLYPIQIDKDRYCLALK